MRWTQILLVTGGAASSVGAVEQVVDGLGYIFLFENKVVITMTALTVLRYLWWVHRRGNSIKTYWLAARGRASALALADPSVVGQYSGVILVRVSFSMACTIHLLSFLYWLHRKRALACQQCFAILRKQQLRKMLVAPHKYAVHHK